MGTHTSSGTIQIRMSSLVSCLILIFLTLVHCGGNDMISDDNDVNMKSSTLGNDKFSSDLYCLMKEEYENFVFSPFSISTVMAMLSAGARGETLKQIKEVLFFPPSPTLQTEYKNILPEIKSTGDFTVATANKLFAKKDFSILRDFQEILNDTFHSSIQNIEVGEPKVAAEKINNWVEEMTKNKIKNLIDESMINENTRLILVNAIYFKSDWAKEFEKSPEMIFNVSCSSQVKVPMMTKRDEVFFANLDNLSSTMIELPYKEDRIVMQILLPTSKRCSPSNKTNNGLEDLEEKLKDNNINELFDKEKKKTKLMIALPKFKLEADLKLKKDLKKLGLMNMFFRGTADFSGITKKKALFVSDVVQKTFIEVGEKGTESAAATAALPIIFRSGSRLPWFRAAHPFIFYLRDKESGMLLFQGRVINPLE